MHMYNSFIVNFSIADYFADTVFLSLGTTKEAINIFNYLKIISAPTLLPIELNLYCSELIFNSHEKF